MSGIFALAAGGTGGHLFPAEALAAELVKTGARVHLFVDRRADAFAVLGADVTIHRIRAGRFSGVLDTARGPAELAIGAVQARYALRRLRPAAVVGFGGYPSMPTMLAAVSLGLPTLIHEQNALLGRANRFLAPLASRIATGFPETLRLGPAANARAVHTGNPVRPAILEFANAEYHPAGTDGHLEILVLGGSQGARILAQIVPAALARLPEPLRRRLRVSQQARPEDLAAAAAAYTAAGISAETRSFFADVPPRMARAHLAITRAGASTVAELSAIGRPALLIPYPYAADDHQTANARAFATAGGGRVIPQADLSADRLAADLQHLFADPGALALMARRAAAFGRRDAVHRLATLARTLEPGAALLECSA